jgi:type IV secretory pathway VirB10-like protein
MMSKTKVEEMRRMKFAKVTNDKDHEVEVTYTDAEGKEVKETVAAGAEIEVPTEAEEAVKTQIAEATAPHDGGAEETDEEREAREKKEADDKAAADAAAAAGDGSGSGEGEGTPPAGESDAEKLSRALAENAELKATQTYDKLLAKGKITPAQKELFMAFSAIPTGVPVALSKDIKSTDGKKVLFAKGSKPSIATMLSAILEAGPKMIKFGEQGGKGESAVELTKEQEEKLTRMGFSVEKFKKQLKAGTITMEDLENE